MRTYTQEEFDAIPGDGEGVKTCPSGDYTQIKIFGEWCSFGLGVEFDIPQFKKESTYYFSKLVRSLAESKEEEK